MILPYYGNKPLQKSLLQGDMRMEFFVKTYFLSTTYVEKWRRGRFWNENLSAVEMALLRVANKLFISKGNIHKSFA